MWTMEVEHRRAPEQHVTTLIMPNGSLVATTHQALIKVVSREVMAAWLAAPTEWAE